MITFCKKKMKNKIFCLIFHQFASFYFSYVKKYIIIESVCNQHGTENNKGFGHMSIYLWLSIILGVVVFLEIILFFRRFLKGKDNGLVIFTILLLGVIASAALYIFTSMNGTLVLSSEFAAEYQIKEETFKTTDTDTSHYLDAGYAFYAENGVKYQLYGTELLEEPSEAPSFIQIFACEAVDGYSWCYLKKGNVVRYKLTSLSRDGNEAESYGN